MIPLAGHHCTSTILPSSQARESHPTTNLPLQSFTFLGFLMTGSHLTTKPHHYNQIPNFQTTKQHPIPQTTPSSHLPITANINSAINPCFPSPNQPTIQPRKPNHHHHFPHGITVHHLSVLNLTIHHESPAMAFTIFKEQPAPLPSTTKSSRAL